MNESPPPFPTLPALRAGGKRDLARALALIETARGTEALAALLELEAVAADLRSGVMDPQPHALEPSPTIGELQQPVGGERLDGQAIGEGFEPEAEFNAAGFADRG